MINIIFRYCIILGLRNYEIPKVKKKYLKTWFNNPNYINNQNIKTWKGKHN